MKLLKCIAYLFSIGIIFFIIGLLLPRKWIHADRLPYRTAKWEKNGKIYDCIKIHRWKNKLPDMSKIYPLMPDKRIQPFLKADDLELMIKETCVAELTHVLLIPTGFGCVWIWKTGGIIMSVFWTICNVPFILIQRYNRPAFYLLYTKLRKKEKVTALSTGRKGNEISDTKL